MAACPPRGGEARTPVPLLRGYILARLAGADAEDPSWASRTMLMDLATSGWSEPILAAVGLPRELLPEIGPSTSAFRVRPGAADGFGLAPGARIVLGGIDNCCAVLGASDPQERRLVNIAGTYDHLAGTGSLEVARAVARAVESQVHGYVLPDRFLTLSRVPLGLLMGALAEASSEDADDLVDGVLPRPAGAPIDLDVAAIRAAVDLGTPPAVVMQAPQGSAAVVLARALAAWEAAGEPPDRIVVVGGGARRTNIVALRAAVLGRPLSRLANDESTGLGALRLAAIAVEGASPAEAAALFANPVTDTWDPDAAPGRVPQRPARVPGRRPGTDVDLRG